MENIEQTAAGVIERALTGPESQKEYAHTSWRIARTLNSRFGLPSVG